MDTLKIINLALTVLFFVCYAYQFAYIPVSLLKREKPHREVKPHRYAVLISARNEERVIANLVASVKAQDYDPSLVTVFIVADNCTDGTAAAAAKAGAIVFERFNDAEVGKGYALSFLLERIESLPVEPYDGYFVFDADNVLEPDYISEMNRTFSDGCDIVTSYRNSKNYGDNWISAGYGLWFLRESRLLNQARCLLGTSASVSGTGFLFSRKVLEECGGWSFFLLTEDIEFTVHNVTRGHKIGYCPRARLYDEQPTSFRQSWRQRLRWSRGYLQVFRKYGTDLVRGTLHGSFSCFDLAMSIMPAAVISVLSLIVNTAAAILGLTRGAGIVPVIAPALSMLLSVCGTMFFIGAVTTASEWKRIYAPAHKKILYCFTFPLFMLTYIPISCCALFCRNPGWKPITHSKNATLADIRSGKVA